MTLSVNVSPVRAITSPLAGGRETETREKRAIEARQRYRESTRSIVGVRIRLRLGAGFSGFLSSKNVKLSQFDPIRCMMPPWKIAIAPGFSPIGG